MIISLHIMLYLTLITSFTYIIFRWLHVVAVQWLSYLSNIKNTKIGHEYILLFIFNKLFLTVRSGFVWIISPVQVLEYCFVYFDTPNYILVSCAWLKAEEFFHQRSMIKIRICIRYVYWTSICTSFPGYQTLIRRLMWMTHFMFI